MLTELGRSQVEVQRCSLSWESPRLRSSLGRWRRARQGGGRGAGGGEGGGGGAEEEEEEI